MGPDCALKNECKEQTNSEKLNMCACKMNDPANAVKQECLHSSCVEELLEKPHEAESLCNVTMPNEAHIKSEEEEIPTSEDFTKSSTSEDLMFELLTSLKQLNLKTVDTCIPETVADSSNSSTVTQNRSAPKQEKILSQYLSQLSSKPFFCELKGCKSAFVTKAALLLHYCKKHEYTKEKALKLNMFQKKFSPFECHICQRRFTRRTLLRFHYKSDHHITKEKPRRNVRKFDKKMKPRIKHQRRTSCWEKLLTNEISCHSNVRTSPVQEGFISETYADSLSDETDSSNAFGALRPDDLTSGEGRGSRRFVEKDKSCYALNKYHKPFHCIHKSCNASFTSQRGLVRHYQLVHQYNRESLCLEKDKEQNKETNKCRKIFTCKYEECRKSFICGGALSKHYKEFHDQSENEEKEVDTFDHEHFLQSETEEDEEKFSEESESDESEIYCDVEGCDAVFTDHTNYSRHIMTRHRKYNLYEGRRKRKKKVQEVDENYIEPKRHKRFFQRKDLKVQINTNTDGKKEEAEIKTRKEALQMCAQNKDVTQFPCMVLGCSSVVKLESSIIRHYKLTHHLSPAYVNNHIHELVYCVKNLSKDAEEFSSPEGSPKSSDHFQDHKITRLSLRSSNIGTSNERGDSYKTSNNDLRKNGSVDRDFFGTSPHNNKISNSINESDMRSSNKRNEDRTSKSSGKENISSFCKGYKEENYKGVHLRDPAESDLLDSTKCNQQDPVQAAIGLTNFKPMGFESSFLKFLQESRNTDEDEESESDEWDLPQKSKRRNSLQNRKRVCKDRNEREIRLSLGKTASSEPTLEKFKNNVR
ncbi:unnamed protein product [Staurois parvus]|uniref:C2H2-type domain-containing protein n=1 Tax=Staurois parvus TaxID=386267 RepID=A0ABN9G5G2_9NEOB|nr:unnamed protein product [Staurois parvus]